jgi:hypothetical protein
MAGAGSSSTYLVLDFQNISPQPVAGIRFTVAYLNSVREVAYSQDITTQTLKLKPGKASATVQADQAITNGLKMETVGWVSRVLFSDGTAWNDDGTKSCAFPSVLGNTKLPQHLIENSRASQTSAAAAAALAETGHVNTQEELRDMVERGEASRCAIITNPPGATVLIDGNEAGITPLAFILIKHGDTPRTITISLKGYKSIEQKVLPDGKNVPLQFKLVKSKD